MASKDFTSKTQSVRGTIPRVIACVFLAVAGFADDAVRLHSEPDATQAHNGLAVQDAPKQAETGSPMDGRATAPLLSIMWPTSADEFTTVSDLGANTAWLTPASVGDVALSARRLRHAEPPLQAMASVSAVMDRVGGVVPSNMRPRQYLASRPATASMDGTLEIDLLAGYAAEGDRSYAIDRTLDPSRLWIVWDLTTGERVSPQAWELRGNGTLAIFDAMAGHAYSAAFIATFYIPYWLDFMHSEARERGWRLLDEWAAADLDIHRATYLSYFYPRYMKADKKYGLLDWYGYNVGIHPNHIVAMEAATGRPFDPEFLVERGALKTTNDVPHEDYFQWMGVIQASVTEFAREFNRRIHENEPGKRTRMFIDDGWIGMEPALGLLDDAGFDEVVTPMNTARDARRIMDFDGAVARIVRIGVWNFPTPSDAEKRISSAWGRGLRGMLFDFPDGITLGGDVQSLVEDFGEESREIEGRIRDIFARFKTYHGLLNGRQAHTVPMNVYVVNAWGPLRAWPKDWTVNYSQQGIEALADLPLPVRFLSLRDIEHQGIPEDADVLVNIGEPGTSWSGGFYWTPTVVAHVRRFVREGGGFLGIDGPTIDGDTLTLADVLGLVYQGPVQEAPEIVRGIWQGPPQSARAALRLTTGDPLFADLPPELGEIRYNARMRPADAGVEVLADSAEGAFVTLRAYGAGKAAYLSGVSDHENYEEFLKRLIYRVADKEELLEELNTPTPGAHVYYYPETRLLVLYNRAACQEVAVQAGLLARPDERVTLAPVAGTDKMLTVTGAELRDGVSLAIKRAEVGIWRVLAAEQ